MKRNLIESTNVKASRCQEERKVAARSQLDPIAGVLQQVLARPDEDEPRHKFASLLKPSNPDKSEFIDAQLITARLRDNLDDAECFKAWLRSARLLELHYDDWRPDWSNEVAGQVQEYEFHRGFVELVQIAGEPFLKAGSALFDHEPIRHLDLVSTEGAWSELHASKDLHSIRSISLDNNGLADKDLFWLAKSPFLFNLRWLSLTNNDKVTQEGVRALAENYRTYLPSLEYISLQGTSFNPVERIAVDGDFITEAWLPEVGKELEAEFGPISWLHRPASHARQIPPNRFAIPKTTGSTQAPQPNTSDQGLSPGVLAEAR